MRAININIEDFINILSTLKAKGHTLIDLDMVEDEHSPTMNKLVIHPVSGQGFSTKEIIKQPAQGSVTEIRDPDIRRDNNDIFNHFDL